MRVDNCTGVQVHIPVNQVTAMNDGQIRVELVCVRTGSTPHARRLKNCKFPVLRGKFLEWQQRTFVDCPVFRLISLFFACDRRPHQCVSVPPQLSLVHGWNVEPLYRRPTVDRSRCSSCLRHHKNRLPQMKRCWLTSFSAQEASAEQSTALSVLLIQMFATILLLWIPYLEHLSY